MRVSTLKSAVIFVIVGIFLTVSIAALAADEQWFVIKDSKGRCKVIKAKAATPKTIDGPFPTKEAAQKAKAEQCPPKAGKKDEKKPPAEPRKKQP